MKPLKRLEVIKEIVEIFERDELSETLDKFWILSGVTTAITSAEDPITVTFSLSEQF